MNDLVAECLIKDFDQRPFMQVSVHLLPVVYLVANWYIFDRKLAHFWWRILEP